jgi:2-C-methyl-D-erythritol 4-phosphate cytidylyltransferase
MGFDKIWAPLRDRPVLSYALEALVSCSTVAEIALVVSSEMQPRAELLCAEFGGRIRICTGGTERQDSVAMGRKLLSDCRWLLVHDAARPFLTADLIHRGLDAAHETGAAVAALPARDTMKRARDGLVLETISRDELWNAQTPQVFRSDVLDRALERGERDVTDEATLVERMGGQVRIFMGSESSWKITTPFDLALAEAWLSREQVPSGE